jgi:DUF3043 family protein
VFGRSKAQETEAATVTTTLKATGKGRATPKRREAQSRNRTPIVGAPRNATGTKEERRAARQAQQAAARAERTLTRTALNTGDERHLPARDKGPAKRFARNYVDARWNAGEIFIPIGFLAVLVSLVNIPIATLGSMVLLYGTAILVGVDCFLLHRRVRRIVTERFGAAEAVGIGRYAIIRAVQIRRARLPRPQVRRGEHVE